MVIMQVKTIRDLIASIKIIMVITSWDLIILTEAIKI